MTCSLQIYRQRIGTYQPSSIRRKNIVKESCAYSGTSSFRTRLTVTLVLINYLMIISFLPIILKQEFLRQDYNHGMSSLYFCTAPDPPKPLEPAKFLAQSPSQDLEILIKLLLPLPSSPGTWDPGPAQHKLEPMCLLSIFEDVEPGILSAASVFIWMTRAQINKFIHIIQGNRGQRGRGITCLYWNKGPSLLTNKLTDIQSIIADHKPHILGLGEANFKNGQDLADVALPGYNLHLGQGVDNEQAASTARVAVYTHTALRVKRRPDLEDKRVAAIWIECGLPQQKGILLCVGYRQWQLLGQDDRSSATVPAQLERWKVFLSKWEAALHEGREVIVMLDANIDFLTWRSSNNLPPHHSSVKLKSLIDELFDRIIPQGVSQLVTGATRIERGYPRTGLDHLYSNRPEKLSQVKTLLTGMSDHKMLKIIRYTKSFKTLPRYVRKRSFKNFNEEDFKLKLQESNLEEILTYCDVNAAAEGLVDKITRILDFMAPIRTFQVRTHYVPGLEEETKRLQAERNMAHEKAAKSDNPEDWRLFRSLRNKATAKIRADKKRWEQEKFSHVENSSSDIWNSVKGWLGWSSGGPPTQLFWEGRMVHRPAGLASSMNRYFVNKVKDLRQKIPMSAADPLRYLREAMQKRECQFKLNQVGSYEVLKLIRGLKNSTATGVDYLDTRTVKLGAEILAPILTHIINLSITSSTFPNIWKWHKVIPLLKSSGSDPLMPKSYRPVALLPILSKLLEKVVFNQLVLYLEQNGLIHPNLHGSRAGHSTATALSQMYDHWLEEVDQGKMVGVLICDQSAAFDLCDHNLLIQKMELMGVREQALMWFRSYLAGRRQSCMVDGQLSAALDLPQCGVPQGSIGGPILWLLFTCDQPDVVHEHKVDASKVDRGCREHDQAGGHGHVHQVAADRDGGDCGLLVGYVDDGAYSVSSTDPTELSRIMNRKYSRLEDWMNSNKLVINADKTHLMVMTQRKDSNKRMLVNVKAGVHNIIPTEKEKMLGGLLHQSLKWNSHIRDDKESLLNQLNSRINGLRKVCSNASFKTRCMIANGIVMSKLVYLITIWGGAQQYLINALQIQQLVAARAVCGPGCWRWSRSKLLGRVGWMSVRQLIFYHTFLQVHKTMKTGLPRSLFESLQGQYPYHIRNASNGLIRPNFATRSTFKHRAAQQYNQVPADIRNGSLPTVKHNLRKWIKSNIPID